ncbi:MAG TPA: Ig-like domain-containing protein, partial [Devosia sp.]
MTATATYGVTSDPYLNGVLSGVKWGVGTLTFSFPQDATFYGTSYGSGENLNNFEAFTPAQQAAVRKVLDMISSVANLNFTEVIETASVHGELRYAESDSTGTAWAYYPSTSALGGDAWFNNTKNYFDNPVVGTYGFLTMMHETGHALGLKHPHEVRGSFGAMPVEMDSLEFTVMSYRSYVGASTSTGYTNGYGSYPQSLMMYDIAALQKMYGADYTTNAGNTVYSWSATTGEMLINGVGQGAPAANKVFMTLWDGGGIDTYDFSNYSGGVKVDLNPGGWSTTSTTQLASLGSGQLARGNIANALLFEGSVASLIENAIGGAGNDTLIGNQADNVLTGGKGNDVIDGGAGNDTAAFSGRQADYSWFLSGEDTWTITDLRTGGDGTDTLKRIEYLQFSDAKVTIGTVQQPQPPPTEPVVVNVAPVAASDSYTATKNTKLSVTAANGVLANDSDAEGQALTATLVSGPSKGTLVFRADGSFDYTPVKNFTGTVSFTYKAGDGTDSSAATTVSIAVGGGTTTSKNGKGNGGESIEEDQAPAPAVDTLATFMSQVTGNGMVVPRASTADKMLGELNTTLSGLNHDMAKGAGLEHLFNWSSDHGELDLAGLPGHVPS